MTDEFSLGEEEYLGLLELSFEVVQSLAGKPADDYRLPDCQHLAAKLYFHAASIYWLKQGTKAPVPRSRSGSSFIDFASIAVLGRAAFETYLTLFEVFFEPQDDDEFEFRHASWQLQGFVLREGFVPSDPDLEEDYVRAQQDIRQLRRRIEATAAFGSFTDKQKKQILKGRRLRTRMDVAEAAGFGKEYIRRVYHYYSDYAHSGGLSAAQMFESKSAEEQRELSEMHLVTAGIALSKQILSYAEKFDEASEVASRFEDALHRAAVLSEAVRRIP